MSREDVVVGLFLLPFAIAIIYVGVLINGF